MRLSGASTIVALTLLVLGCGASESAGPGRVTVLLKDAPGDVQAAVVTISEVSLVGGGGTVVLRDSPLTTDLLTLATDVATLVDAAAVPAGTYEQLRFVITGGYLDVGGTIYASSPTYEGLPPGAAVGGELQMPSYARSGLKVILPAGGVVVDAGSQTWVVDFDVSQSFGHVTGTDKWVMHPVIKATAQQETGAVVATLTVPSEIALPPELGASSFVATLTAPGGDVSALPMSDLGSGVFGAAFSMLAPGQYQVDVVLPDGLLGVSAAPAGPVTVTVLPAQTTTQDFILTGG
jgi:hypothetical protein